MLNLEESSCLLGRKPRVLQSPGGTALPPIPTQLGSKFRPKFRFFHFRPKVSFSWFLDPKWAPKRVPKFHKIPPNQRKCSPGPVQNGFPEAVRRKSSSGAPPRCPILLISQSLPWFSHLPESAPGPPLGPILPPIGPPFGSLGAHVAPQESKKGLSKKTPNSASKKDDAFVIQKRQTASILTFSDF